MKHNKQTVRSTYCRLNSKDKQRVITKYNLLGISDKEQCNMALIVWRVQCQKKPLQLSQGGIKRTVQDQKNIYD